MKSGGLGIRRVSSLALPAFLASAVNTRDLQNQILHADVIMLDNAPRYLPNAEANTLQLHALA